MSNWQETGIRLGGAVLDEGETRALVEELKKRIKDPSILEEIKGLLAGRRRALPARVRDALQLVSLGILMARKK